MRGEGGVAGSQPVSTAEHRSPNKLWASNSIFNLLIDRKLHPFLCMCRHQGHLYSLGPRKTNIRGIDQREKRWVENGIIR
jgi:hypothetical protein